MHSLMIYLCVSIPNIMGLENTRFVYHGRLSPQPQHRVVDKTILREYQGNVTATITVFPKEGEMGNKL